MGLSYTGWLACNQHGTVYVGQDPDAALELIRQWLPVVWEAWYFCMPRPEFCRHRLWLRDQVQGCGVGRVLWVGRGCTALQWPLRRTGMRGGCPCV